MQENTLMSYVKRSDLRTQEEEFCLGLGVAK